MAQYLFICAFALCLGLLPGCTGGENAPSSKESISTDGKSSPLAEANEATATPLTASQANPPEGMVLVPETALAPAFFMDATEVTNQEFAAFVEATGYVTIAEQALDWEVEKQSLPPGTPKPPDSVLAPGALVFQGTEGPVDLSMHHLWWQWVIGANWRHPLGPGSSIDSLDDHPVVQIAWDDAVAYAEWAGKRLPSQAEWEQAAQAGQPKQQFPWGNDSPEAASDRANFWQGAFPYENALQDGFYHTAPVGSYPANAYGIHDLAGNVWEWCQDQVHDPNEPLAEKHAVKGGSFLCNDVYCSGYRIEGSMSTTATTGLNHTGFRCVMDMVP